MELFRFANGMSSEDFIKRDSQNTPSAFYGGMWKFTRDQAKSRSTVMSPQELVQQKLAARDQQKFSLNSPLDNELTRQAKELGYPEQRNDSFPQGQGQAATPQASDEDGRPGDADEDAPPAEDDGTTKYSREDLEAMQVPELKSIAASVGIANLDQAKAKLVKAILDKSV